MSVRPVRPMLARRVNGFYHPDYSPEVTVHTDGKHIEYGFFFEGLTFHAGKPKRNLKDLKSCLDSSVLFDSDYSAKEFKLALMYSAAVNGQYYLIKYLVESGVNITHVWDNGQTVVHWAETKEFLQWCLDHGSLLNFDLCSETPEMYHRAQRTQIVLYTKELTSLMDFKCSGPEVSEYIVSEMRLRNRA